MSSSQVQFSIVSHAAWAPGVATDAAWLDWARSPYPIAGTESAPVEPMPPMLRRRAGFLGKMALQVAYQCLDGREAIPAVFCSRHGDAARGLELLGNVVVQEPMSPTSFGLAVHNANAGLFSIARHDQANYSATAAGSCTVEYGVIEACSLLADGARQVLLVVVDSSLPDVYAPYQDCLEQPHAWAWLMERPGTEVLRLAWSAAESAHSATLDMPASLALWRFYLNQKHSDAALYERVAERRSWRWSRNA